MNRVTFPRTSSASLWRKWAFEYAQEIRDALWGCNCALAVWMHGPDIEYDASDARPGWMLVGVYDEYASPARIADDIEATAQPEFAA